MGIARRHLRDLTAITILSAFSVLAAACSSLIPATRADCNVVRIQREAGRSDAEIASALGVTQDDVGRCAGGSGEMYGGAGAAAETGAASGSEGAPAQAGSGAESGSGESGSSSSSPY